jgi:CHAT domain-containing protein/Tfp pilus assembly protein PilF
MKKLGPCLLVLLTLLLHISAPAHTAPPAQTPTPPPTQAQADALLGECIDRHNQGDSHKALEKCQVALLLYQEVGDQAGEAMALNSIGMIYDSLSNYAQALAYFQQALVTTQKIDDEHGEAVIRNNIGGVFHELGEYEEAVVYLKQALEIFRELGERGWEALTLHNIGEIYKDLNAQERALVYYKQAVPIFREIGSQTWEAKILNDIGEIYHHLDDYEQALAYLEQAQIIARQIGHLYGEATTLHNIGGVYFELANYEQALVYFEQALRIRREVRDQAGEALTLNAIGIVYKGLGDYRQALTYLEQALSVQREIEGWREAAITLNNSGGVYRQLGDYKQALSYYQRALIIWREIGDQVGEAEVLNNIGVVYHDLGDYQQALAYYKQALPIRREIRDRAGEARTLGNIGVVYSSLGNYEKAMAYLQQALPIRREIGDREGEAATLNNIGLTYYHLGDHVQALTYYEQALLTAQEIRYRHGQPTAQGNLAALYEAQEQEEQALDYALQAIAVLETTRGEIKVEALQTAFAASIAGYYHYAVRLLLTEAREAEAFHYAERGRARTLLTLLGNQGIDAKGGEDPDLIEREVQLRGELTALESQLQEEWSKPADQRSQQVIKHVTASLEAGRQEYEDLLIQLQLTNPEYAALVSVDPLTLEETQGLLRDEAPDVTLLAYFIGKGETTIFVLGLESYHAQAVPVTREELRQQAEALLAQMRAAPLLPNAWQEPAQTLYGWLIAPVQKYLPHASAGTPPHLGIIPHDLLHYLPFGLLYDGKYTLLEGHTLFYAPSASSLRFIFDKRHPEADTLLAFANPDAPGAPHLSHAVAEAEAVTTLYDTEPVIGAEATEGHFKSQAGEFGLVHVAAHSDYNPHSPLFSAIMLQADESEDGRLETHEVFNLNLPQTDLVVLSACQTHLGELSAGDELVGLERAFVRAGSPSLLSTLWPVDDAATAVLMERFYSHLRAEVPKAEALRLAQLETRAENPQPYYWAGFVLVGDAGREPRDREGSEDQHRWLPWAVIGLIVVLIGATAFWWRRRRRGPRGGHAG